MDNNLCFFRSKARISKKTLSKLLNTSVYTYMGYENNRLIIPTEIKILYCKLMDIPINDLFCNIESISNSTIKKMSFLSELDEQAKERKLIFNLTGEENKLVTYTNINSIKQNIYQKIKDKEVP